MRVLAARIESDGLLDPRGELRQRFQLVASRLLVAEEGTEALGQRLLLLLGWDDGDLQRVDQRQHVAGQQVLDLRHETRQADALIDVALGLAEGRRDVVDRPARRDQALVADALVEWVDVLAVEVLDDRRFVSRGIIEFEDTRGHRRAARELRGTQPPCAGDQHEPVAVGADEDRLQHAVTTDAGGQFVEAGLGERAPWIGRRFVDDIRRQLSELTHSYTSSEMGAGAAGAPASGCATSHSRGGTGGPGPARQGLVGERSRAGAGPARPSTRVSGPW